MANIGDGGSDSTINPYIALSDIVINLLLVVLLFSVTSIIATFAAQEDYLYRDSMSDVEQAVEAAFDIAESPRLDLTRNDPAGVQRWVLEGDELFRPGESTLHGDGKQRVIRFAEVLRSYSSKWRRIRIEGHTLPPLQGQEDDWELSAARAADAARVLSSNGRIPPYFLAVAARGGQNPLYPDDKDDLRNSRIEFVIEFSRESATE